MRKQMLSGSAAIAMIFVGAGLATAALVNSPDASDQANPLAPATTRTAPKKLLLNALIFAHLPPGIGDATLSNNSVVIRDEEAVRHWARGLAASHISYVTLDIEDQPTDRRHFAPAKTDAGMRYLIKRVAWVKEEAPSVKVGLFGYPMADFYTTEFYEMGAAVRRGQKPESPDAGYYGGPGWNEIARRFTEYQKANDALQPLYDKLDFMAPELYTHADLKKKGQLESFEMFARATVAECRRLQPNKPVYPFMMPCYTPDAAPVAWQDVDAVSFAAQMRTVWQAADGIILWGGWKAKGRVEWDPHAPWVGVIQSNAYRK